MSKNNLDWLSNEPPDLPPVILQAAKEARLVIFIGAGASILMGCPSWGELADAILNKLAIKGKITFGDIEQLSHLDAKKRISIALEISDIGQNELTDLIQPKKTKNSKIYEHLKKIGCVYVTTNYDEFLDTPNKGVITEKKGEDEDSKGIKETELICFPSQFKSSHLMNPGSVIHIHGSIKEPDSMILTTPDYLKHYQIDQVKNFLVELFNNYTVLFIGYGLEEWEILEYILRVKINKSEHFMLTGFYQHQKKTFEHLHNYYKNSFSVELIPYPMDFLKYKQLEKVIEDWSVKLKVGDPSAVDKLNFVLRAIDE